MPTQKTLREIIEKLSWALCMTCSNPSVPDCDKEKIDSTISEIKSLIKEKLPKQITVEEVKPKSCPYSNKIKCCTMQDYSKNECLTEIEKIVEEL